MEKNASLFQDFIIGTTQPVSIPMETVEVEVGADSLLDKYAVAFVNEAYRVNPLKAEQVNLQPKELDTYLNYLLSKRIETVHSECRDFRKLKALYIPSYPQHALSCIGIVYKWDDGLKLIPVSSAKVKMTFEEALVVSEKVGSFENDLQIVRDAMPRDLEGNEDVMLTALIAGYVRAIKPVSHVTFTYITKFLGMKLREEAAFAALYRKQYDDIGLITSALVTQKGIF